MYSLVWAGYHVHVCVLDRAAGWVLTTKLIRHLPILCIQLYALILVFPIP